MYNTVCPRCGASDCLYVVRGQFRAYGVALNEEGYNLSDGNDWTTSDEIVACEKCGREFPLAQLATEEPDPRNVEERGPDE